MQPITNLIDKNKFDAMTPAEKRIAICQDVIMRIEAENFIQNEGQILKGEAVRGVPLDLKKAINNKTCEVCARGAILCSWIGNFNKVKWADIKHMIDSGYEASLISTYSSTRFPEQVLEVFPREMLDNIEAAFEKSSYSWHYSQYETKKYAEAFKQQFENEDNEMEWRGTPIVDLMKYITDNNGEFPLPEQK